MGGKRLLVAAFAVGLIMAVSVPPALAGGATLKSGPSDKVALAISAPSGNPPTGWRTGGLEVNGGTTDPWQLTVYAVCAKVAG